MPATETAGPPSGGYVGVAAGVTIAGEGGAGRDGQSARPAGSYARAVTLSGVVNIGVSGLATAVAIPALVRQAGIDAYGTWAMLGLFVPLSSLALFGSRTVIVYYIARSPQHARACLEWAARRTGLALLAAAAVLLGLQAGGVPVLGDAVAAQPGIAGWVLGCGILIAALSAATGLCRGLLESRDLADRNNAGFAVLTVGQYATVLAVAYATSDVRWLLSASVLVYALVFALHVAWVRPLVPAKVADRPVATTGYRDYAMRSVALEFLPTIFAPLMLLGVAHAAADTGEYAVFDISVRIAAMAASAVSLIGVPVFAATARAGRAGHAAARSDAVRRATIALAVAATGWLLYLVVGDWLIAAIGLQPVQPIHQASAIVMAGSAVMGAMDSVVRYRQGSAALRHPIGAWGAAVVAALLLAALLDTTAVLARYAWAMAAGYLVGAAVLGLGMTGWGCDRG